MPDRPNTKENAGKKPLLTRIRYRLEYIGFLIGEALLRSLSRESAHNFARSLGRVTWLLSKRRRRIALANVAAAYAGEKSFSQIRRIARKNFLHIAETAVDLVRSTEMNNDNLDEFFIFEGADIIERELEKIKGNSKGFILISAHLGSQEMLIGHILKYGRGKETVITKCVRNPYLDNYLQAQREKLGVKVLPHRGSGKEIIKRLTSGEVLFFLLDQRASFYEGVKCDFFGRPVVAHKAAAQLALTFNLPVIPVFVPRNDDGRYRLIYQEPLDLARTDDMEKDIRENTQLIQNTIEQMVRLYPKQWWWPHDRWKHGEAAPNE